MALELAVRGEGRIGWRVHLASGPGRGIGSARPVEVAELAVFLIRRVEKGSPADEGHQVAEDGAEGGGGSRRAPHALSTALHRREVVAGADDARGGIRRPEQLGRGERVEGVLKRSPAREPARPGWPPEAARLVVDDLV